MIDLIPFFLAPLLLLPPELCKVPRSLLHRTRMGMPKKSCDLKCGKYPPSNLFKSVQLIFVYITLLPISAHHGDLPAMTMTYTKLSGESPVIAPILRTPPLRWRAQWWAYWWIQHELSEDWVPPTFDDWSWLIIIVHFKHCHFRQNPIFRHTQILSISCCWLYPTRTAFLWYRHYIPSISTSIVGYGPLNPHEIPMKSPLSHH